MTPQELLLLFPTNSAYPATLPPLTPGKRIFYQDHTPWRWKGVTAFKLLERFHQGEDIDPFLKAVEGFNLLRVFYWTPQQDWKAQAWAMPPDEVTHAFLQYVRTRGFYVELTLITAKLPLINAQWIVSHTFSNFEEEENLLVELVNEPQVYDKPPTQRLKVPLTNLNWTSGDYDDALLMKGTYGVCHTQRDGEWPRRAHDLLEYREGGGPGAPSDPAHPMPIVADEPIRPDQAGYVAEDFEAYFGVSALLGAGATFHYESGKLALPPNEQEAGCMRAALKGLEAFPAEAPMGGYERPVEQSLRTYVVGDCMVRVRPTTDTPPLSGFKPVGGSRILYIR